MSPLEKGVKNKISMIGIISLVVMGLKSGILGIFIFLLPALFMFKEHLLNNGFSSLSGFLNIDFISDIIDTFR